MVKTKVVQFRATKNEYQELLRCAGRNRLSLSGWMRTKLLKLARKNGKHT